VSKEQVFQLDARLENDTKLIAFWPLCDLLLMDDSQYPWCILVPRVANLSEIYQLSLVQRQQLDLESIFLSTTLMDIFKGDKLNVAALGNVVKQLHIHHVVRFADDPTWPAPIWGKLPAKVYSEEGLKACLEKLSNLQKPDWAAIALSNV
jgi:diadenosine tetraphosphate (Ap4A) HIT family hydrolase